MEATSRKTIAEPSSFEYTPGKGVRATVQGHSILAGNSAYLTELGVTLPAIRHSDGTHVLIARDGRFRGAIHIGDQVREEAREAIAQLKAMGMNIALLTGDRSEEH